MSCPCGTGKEYAACCKPIITGEQKPATPEALMRARYTGYVKGEVDFLLGSLHPDGSSGVDRESTRQWSQNADWHGLEILGTSAGGEKDETGEVEFVAKYSMQGEPQRHHERAYFKRNNGNWLFLDGQEIHPAPVVGPKVKIGRNDTCLCGSGGKFKKCCRSVIDSGASSPEALVRARFVAPLVGEARFLARSLHPEATQAAATADEEPATSFELVKVDKQGDTALVDVALGGEGSAPRRERHTVKNVKGRWLFASAAAQG